MRNYCFFVYTTYNLCVFFVRLLDVSKCFERGAASYARLLWKYPLLRGFPSELRAAHTGLFACKLVQVVKSQNRTPGLPPCHDSNTLNPSSRDYPIIHEILYCFHHAVFASFASHAKSDSCTPVRATCLPCADRERASGATPRIPQCLASINFALARC